MTPRPQEEIRLRLDKRDADVIRKIAQASFRSVSDQIRFVLADYLRREAEKDTADGK